MLVIHGLADKYLLSPALNGTWEWVENTFTLVTIPRTGHWVHHDAKEAVNKHLKRWLVRE